MEGRWLSRAGAVKKTGIVLVAILMTGAVAFGNGNSNRIQNPENAPGVNGIIFATAQKAITYFSFSDHQEKGFVNSRYKYKQDFIHGRQHKNFDIKFTMGIDSDDMTTVKMNAIRMDSYLLYTYINSSINYETGDIKFGFTNSKINDLMGEGVHLEMVADGSNGSGAIIYSLDF